MRILILEDNLDRRRVMVNCLQDRFPQYPVEFFEASKPMISRMRQGIDDVALISLDHDLELVSDSRGELRDPGTGVDVTHWLAERPSVCPVIIHTTNSAAGNRMEEDLASSGWSHKRIVPYSGEDWIPEVWSRSVRDLIVREIPRPSQKPCSWTNR